MHLTPYNKKSESLAEEKNHFGYSFFPGLLFVALLWLIALLSYLTDANLVWLGVLPRNFYGIVGVFLGPLIHSGLLHLLSNTFPLVLLSGFILFLHRRVALRVIVLVYLLSGFLTWLIGRQAYHIGASGVVYGLAGYLLFNGFIRRNRGAMAVSFAVLFLYSGLFYGLFPNDEGVSWEGHIAGLVAGFIAAVVYGETGTEGQQIEALDEIEQHRSSTLGEQYSYFKINYIISSDKEEQKHYHYNLNPNDYGLFIPTNKKASTSTKKKKI
ncbi:rhomboid family intramembrane serine protease [Pontibacter silvestris]|uniref:Rhomboid family intramembrane serine protease n=1 Tax=Pontibacter silvestris TaxID=2305183 RepID=A0ABW4X202_9BACT|nr:rhomboid family intramembrane serine protease [Pontibacter silvestris]MCC9135011.1 rhomboid family intramembrane serine protease [Pontibacter silvestris]